MCVRAYVCVRVRPCVCIFVFWIPSELKRYRLFQIKKMRGRGVSLRVRVLLEYSFNVSSTGTLVLFTLQILGRDSD